MTIHFLIHTISEPRHQSGFRSLAGATIAAIHDRTSAILMRRGGGGPRGAHLFDRDLDRARPGLGKGQGQREGLPRLNGFLSPISMMCMPPGANVTF